MRSEWLALAGLGAYHGLNPAMGWLFAVSLGLQQGDRRAVLRALGPIAIGHELSVLLIAGAVLGLGVLTDDGALRIGAAIVLVVFGVFRFAKPGAHPRWTKMQVDARELGWWSFLMSSAHGAGLMVAPVLIGGSVASASGGHSHAEAVAGDPWWVVGVGLSLHVAAMLLVMGVVAVLVYDRFGVGVLRKTWLNTEHVWAAAFVLAGVWTLVT